MAKTTDMPETDRRVWELFHAAVAAAGGLGALVEQRRLGLLVPLMESACVRHLQEEEGWSPEAIAERFAVDRERVEEVLVSAPPLSGGG